jgi:hypothetical protein
MTLRGKYIVLSTVLLLAYSPVLRADWNLPSGRISVRNGPSGSVLLDLAWLEDTYCQPFYPLALDPPAVSRTGQTIAVSTTNYFFDCAPPPPGFVFTPMSRVLTGDAGALPDGIYSVTWSFRNSSGDPQYPPPIVPITATFTVVGGRAVMSPSDIPVLHGRALLLLALALALAGCVVSARV